MTAAAWQGRLGPGLTAVVLSTLATIWSLAQTDPALLHTAPIILSLAIYFFAATGITFALASMHRARDRAAAAEAEMKTARDEALAANQAKDDFLAMLSHELRTPLNPALLMATESAADPALAGATRERFEIIARQIRLEAQLIDDLLDLNRLALGKLQVDRRAMELHAMIRDAADIIREEVAAKQLRLEFALHASRSVVNGDPVRLRQVFWNLLRNAVKFSAPGQPILIASADRGGEIEVRVVDAGIGMNAADLTRVFEPFVQGAQVTGRTHEYGGMGLGLAICQAVIGQHGGTIRAESPGPGQGSSLVVTLPAIGVPAPATAGNNHSEEIASKGLPAGCRILLVEDHESSRQALTRTLERRGAQVTTASSFTEALARANEGAFDLVISDLGLPDRDGSALLGELRKHHPGLRGIALSGYGMEADLSRTRNGGFTTHLIKPVSISTLEEAIERALSAPSPAGRSQ